MIFSVKQLLQNVLILALSSVLFQFCNCESKTQTDDPSYYIVNGTIVDNHDLGKYVVSIQWKSDDDRYFGWGHMCAGSIVGERKILTAGHCIGGRTTLVKPRDIVVVVGLRNRFTRTNTTFVKEVEKTVRHKSYGKKKKLYADIGYIILKEKILFDNTHADIVELADRSPDADQNCTIIGWGRIFYKGPASDELRFADVKVIGRTACKRKYSSMFTTGMICAGDPQDWRKDACTGDSGGPLICGRKLVGIVSWGIGCGWKEMPGIYTDVYYFKHWIESNGHKLCVNYAIIVVFLIKLWDVMV